MSRCRLSSSNRAHRTCWFDVTVLSFRIPFKSFFSFVRNVQLGDWGQRALIQSLRVALQWSTRACGLVLLEVEFREAPSYGTTESRSKVLALGRILRTDFGRNDISTK